MARRRARAVKMSSPSLQSSTLIQLPPELRNRIFLLVFRNGLVKVPSAVSPGKNKKLLNLVGRTSLTTAPGLLLTCKQVYNEATAQYYHQTTFCFDSLRRVRSWTRKLGPGRLAVVQAVQLENEVPSVQVSVIAQQDPVRALAILAAKAKDQLRELAGQTGIARSALRMGICLPSTPVTSGFAAFNFQRSMVWTSTPIATVNQYLETASDVALSKVPAALYWTQLRLTYGLA